MKKSNLNLFYWFACFGLGCNKDFFLPCNHFAEHVWSTEDIIERNLIYYNSKLNFRFWYNSLPYNIYCSKLWTNVQDLNIVTFPYHFVQNVKQYLRNFRWSFLNSNLRNSSSIVGHFLFNCFYSNFEMYLVSPKK